MRRQEEERRRQEMLARQQQEEEMRRRQEERRHHEADMYNGPGPNSMRRDDQVSYLLPAASCLMFYQEHFHDWKTCKLGQNSYWIWSSSALLINESVCRLL